MRTLSDTIARLSAVRVAGAAMVATGGSADLIELKDFGSNPGALRGYVHAPETLAEGAALVVVLHGCTQNAAGYDIGSGWSDLADRYGFAILFPQQQRANNPNLCFNWFAPDDIRRGSGEVLSIRQMVGAVVDTYAIHPAKVFVTGLSAGGAMTATMLATYPEVFAGGAIIAGLPYGCASSVPQALDRMRGHGLPGDAALAARARDASDHVGRWPTVSVWHGTADATVALANADAVVRQWGGLHEVGAEPDRSELVNGHVRHVWHDPSGRAVIERYSIAGMGHGTPIATTGEDGCGKAGAYMLETGISSSHRICDFWGLTRREAAAGWTESRGDVRASDPAEAAIPTRRLEAEQPVPQAVGVGKVIEDALRAAGLMR